MSRHKGRWRHFTQVNASIDIKDKKDGKTKDESELCFVATYEEFDMVL